MNAQSTHPIRTSITHTTDPQFLGPEAGQQAEVKAGVDKPTSWATCGRFFKRR